MANGDVSQVTDSYLQQFDKSVGVSGMQKLQEFPALQKLGYNGQLGSLKNDFHGLQDFKSQMDKYSSVSHTLKIAWKLIKYIVPNNASIQDKLFSAPGLGTVGNEFKSIHSFAQVFALSPGDLKSPATVSAKSSVYKNQSSQANVVTDFSSSTDIGGGASITNPVNANSLNGIQIVGTPSLSTPALVFNGIDLIWTTSSGGGGGGSSTLAGDTDVSIISPTNGQVLTYNSSLGKWQNQTATGGGSSTLAADTDVSLSGLANNQFLYFNNSTGKWQNKLIAESDVTNLVSDLAAITSSLTSYQLLSGKDAVNGYAGLTSGGLLKTAEFPSPSATTFGGIKSLAAVAHEFLTSIGTDGVPVAAQPVDADISFSDITTGNVSISAHGFVPKAPNDATKFLDGTGAFSTPAGTGTVTSVALTAPPEFNVSGSPITGSGTIAITKANESANLIYSGPGSGPAAAPTFRSLVAADVPFVATQVGVQNESYTYAVDTGTANTYAVILSPAPASYAAGLQVVFKATNANTGASTLNVNGLGAVAIDKNGSVVLGSGDIAAGQIVTVVYDGTNFQLQSAAATAGGGSVTSVSLSVPPEFTVSGSPITGAGTLTINKANESANTVFAGPTSGGAVAPTFRTLVPADCPAMVASGASHKAGIVPDPGAVAGTTKFLREDASFAQVRDSDLSVSDITTNNVTTSAHGFVPKAPNDATKFLDGTGAYSIPSVGATVAGFAYGGDGSDGAVVFDGSSTVLGFVPNLSAYILNRDIYCTTLVVNSGVVLKTGNCVIHATLSITANGTIRSNGTTGANGGVGSPTGTGGAAGIAGAHADLAGSTNFTSTLPFPFNSGSGSGGTNGGVGNTGAGSQSATPGAATGASNAIARSATVYSAWASGAGGAGSGGAGGAAQNSGSNAIINSEASQPRAIPVALTFRNKAAAALLYTNGAPLPAGGGGGGGDGTNKGAGGGGSGTQGGCGGYIVLCSPTITIGASGVISANGATGSNGGLGGTPTLGNCGGGGGGAGGAGGNGGVVVLIYHTLINNGTLSANAGSGGNGGTHGNGVGTGANGNDGAAGPTGTAGLVIQIAEPNNTALGLAGIVIDGSGSVPATGSKGYVQIPYSGTITSWTMISNVAGSAQITIKKSSYSGFPTTSSIVASAPPSLSSAQKNTSNILTGWTTSVTAGDVLEFNLDSITTITRVVLELQLTKS